MKKDIENIQDIEQLINSFYDRVRADAAIGFIFNDIAKVNWEKHLPIMYNFWESVIFNTGTYKGNAIAAHADIASKVQFTKQHFDQWVKLFKENADNLFEGNNTEIAKQRAMSIATVMQLKMLYDQPSIPVIKKDE